MTSRHERVKFFISKLESLLTVNMHQFVDFDAFNDDTRSINTDYRKEDRLLPVISKGREGFANSVHDLENEQQSSVTGMCLIRRSLPRHPQEDERVARLSPLPAVIVVCES
jgi:hypothetical protein